MIRPVQDICIIERIEDEPGTECLIVMPDNVEKKITMGKVIAVGPRVTEVFKGETVYFNDWAGLELVSDGKDLLGMRESDIEGVVTGEIK